jgi:hypothetical protein
MINKLKQLPFVQLRDELESIIEPALDDLMNDEGIAGEIASTSATGFALDEHDLDLNGFVIQNNTARVPVSFAFEGEQDDEKPWSGTRIKGTCIAVIDADGDITFEEIKAERNLDEPQDA